MKLCSKFFFNDRNLVAESGFNVTKIRLYVLERGCTRSIPKVSNLHSAFTNLDKGGYFWHRTRIPEIEMNIKGKECESEDFKGTVEETFWS